MNLVNRLLGNRLFGAAAPPMRSFARKRDHSPLSHYLPAFRRFATAFPIVKDPKAITLKFKETIDPAAWNLEKPIDPKERKNLVNTVVELNDEKSLSELFFKKPWCIESFNGKQTPTLLGPLQKKNAFSQRESDRYHLFIDMPIRLSGKGWKIPVELAQYREAIERSALFERLINPNYSDYHVYLTVDQRPVLPGQSQRRTGWHADSYINIETRIEAGNIASAIETDSIYLVSDCLPTEFCPGPFAFRSLDPNHTEQVLQHFETTAKGKEIATYPPYSLLRMGPECIHRVGINTLNTLIPRTFLKITFSRQILNRQGNSLNPLFHVNWPVYPRLADKRNHSNQIDGYRTDADKYRLVSEKELLKAFNSNCSQAIKSGTVTGCLAAPGEVLQTVNNNFLTTVTIANPGDWKITSPCGAQDFLATEKFQELYSPLAQELFAAKRIPVSFIPVIEPIKIMAPWGSLQYLRAGDYLVRRENEIYGVLKTSFAKNYTVAIQAPV